jgi:hypothetical protein
MGDDRDGDSSEILKAEEGAQPGRLSRMARRAKAEMVKGQPTKAEKADRAETVRKQQAEARRYISVSATYLGGPPLEGLSQNARVRISVDWTGIVLIAPKGTRLEFPWSVIENVQVESAEQVRDRITATRAVFLGAFAIAFRKQEMGGPYLTMETRDGPQIFDTRGTDGRRLAARLAAFHKEMHASGTQPVEKSQPSEPEPGAGDPDPIAKIRELGELRETGLITDEEFEAKKAELLDRL